MRVINPMSGKRNAGFSMVEIMVVVAIVGLLAALALPAYTDYVTRSRVTEGLVLADAAKLQVGMRITEEPLAAIANEFNAQANATGATSKYVRSVQINNQNGTITITLNEANIGGISAATRTLTLTPYIVRGAVSQQLAAAIVAGTRGTVAWGCASDSSAIANAAGLAPVTMGTLPARFAPSSCR